MAYRIRQVEPKEDLFENMLRDGYVSFDEEKQAYFLNPDILYVFQTGSYHPEDYDKIWVKRNSETEISYQVPERYPIGWVSDEIAKKYPEALFSFDERVNYHKNGKTCNRKGEEIIYTIYGVNKNLVSPPRNGKVTITLPIGNSDDKWGSFTVDESDVININRQTGAKDIFLTKETYDLTFRQGTRTFEAERLIEVYYDNLRRYGLEQNEKLILRNLNQSDCIDRGNYYIVNVKVFSDMFPSEVISTTVNKDFVVTSGNGNLDVRLGFTDYDRNVKYIDERGYSVYTHMKCSKLKELHDNWVSYQRDLEEMEEEER